MRANIISVIEDRMARALAGERIDWKGPGITYGDAVRSGLITSPSVEEIIQRAVSVNEMRPGRPLTRQESAVVREAIENAR